MAAIPNTQKHTTDHPCGVCVGYESGKRGSGERCWGFTSEDDKYVYCSRDDHAGGLQMNASAQAYRHYMVGKCDCGTNHTGSFTAPTPSSHSNGTSSNATKQPLGDPVAVYKYDSGSEPFEVLKFEPKTFRQCRYVDGKRVWNLNGVTTCLYRQKEVEAAGINEPIYIVEGERDVDGLYSRELVATCNPMGAGKWKPHYNETFTNRTVIVIPDNDQVGDDHAEAVAAGVYPVAQSVKIIRLPNIPEHGDVSDFIEAGGTREQINDLIAITPEWSPVVAGGWGSMEPLPAATPAVPTLPPDLLPMSLRPWLVEAANRAAVPLEFVVVSALCGLGSVIGRQVGIKPDKFDDYTNIPNLWGAIVGRPGTKKSHAISEGLRPVTRLEAEASDAYENDGASREAERAILKAETSALESKIKQAFSKAKSSTEIDLLQLELQALIEKRDEADVPARRFMTQDATVEKLGELLQENPNGLLVSRDELAGFLQTLERAGREGDREFFLESWNGTGSFNVDRIGRGLVRIKSLTVTLCGSIQPGKLKRYISDAMSDGAGSDGLLQRVQLLVYPDDEAFPEWNPNTEWVDTTAKNLAFDVYKRLSNIKLPNSVDSDSTAIPALNFTDEAQELHNEWAKELETRIRTEFADAPAFESHISKYRSLAPSLALIYHLADLQDGAVIGDVGFEVLKQALGMCDFLEAHARKIFAQELNPGLHSAFALSKKILSGAVTDGENIRFLYRHGWSDLKTPTEFYSAVDVLERFGWVRIDREGSGGQATETLSLHPDLLGGKTSA